MDTAERQLEGNSYYEWIVEGLRLYDALAREPVEVVECFPTASWTRWHGSREGCSRAAWTREALAALNLEGLPSRTNQDVRDAIAAALTARDYAHDHFDAFGDIIRSPSCLTRALAPFAPSGSRSRRWRAGHLKLPYRPPTRPLAASSGSSTRMINTADAAIPVASTAPRAP